MYKAQMVADFEKKIKKHTKRNMRLRNQINEIIKELRLNPYITDSVQLIEKKFKGKRRLHLGRAWRLIYAVCEECRQRGFSKTINCIGCHGISDQTIILFDFEVRSRVYK